MKLIIDIPEDKYEWLKKNNPNADTNSIVGAIANGTPYNERPQGEWIEHQDCYDDTYYTCSHCGEDWTTIEGDPTDNLMNYCPMCGADMKGEDNVR